MSDGRIVSFDTALKLTKPEEYGKLVQKGLNKAGSKSRIAMWELVPNEVQEQVYDSIPYDDLIDVSDFNENRTNIKWNEKFAKWLEDNDHIFKGIWNKTGSVLSKSIEQEILQRKAKIEANIITQIDKAKEETPVNELVEEIKELEKELFDEINKLNAFIIPSPVLIAKNVKLISKYAELGIKKIKDIANHIYTKYGKTTLSRWLSLLKKAYKEFVDSQSDKAGYDTDIDIDIYDFEDSYNLSGRTIIAEEKNKSDISTMINIAREYVKILLEKLKYLIKEGNYKHLFAVANTEIVIIVKPLAYEMGGDVLVEKFIRKNGGIIKNSKKLRVDSWRIAQHYGGGKSDKKNKSYFYDLVEYYTGKDVKVYRVKINKNNIDELRGLIGSASVEEGSFRYGLVGEKYKEIQRDYGVLDNGIHCSDSVEEGKREIDIWFGIPPIITEHKEAHNVHQYLFTKLSKIDSNVQFSGGTLDGTQIESKDTDLDYRLFFDNPRQAVKIVQDAFKDDGNFVFDQKGIDEKTGTTYYKFEYKFKDGRGKADISIVKNIPEYTNRVSANHLATLMSEDWKRRARSIKEFHYKKVREIENKVKDKSHPERQKVKEEYERVKEKLRSEVAEWFGTDKAVNTVSELYKSAEKGKKELDEFLDKISAEIEGVGIVKVPLKSPKSLLTKTQNKYRGKIQKAHDIARATIVIDENSATNTLKKISDIIKDTFPQYYADNYFKESKSGYRGVNISILTNNDGVVELQINIPEMIYLKEKKEDAKHIIGDDKYKELDTKYNGKGGYGHILYDLSKEAKLYGATELQNILEQDSIKYYADKIIPGYLSESDLNKDIHDIFVSLNNRYLRNSVKYEFVEGDNSSVYSERRKKVLEEIEKIEREIIKESSAKLSIGIDPKISLLTAKLVSKYIQYGYYKLREILSRINNKYGEDTLKKLFPYIKKSYIEEKAKGNSELFDDDNDISNTDISNFKPIVIEEDQLSLFGETKSNIQTADLDTLEGIRTYLRDNKIEITYPDNYYSELEKKAYRYAIENTAEIIKAYTDSMKANNKEGVINTDDIRRMFEPAGYNYYNSDNYHNPAANITNIIYSLYLKKYRGTNQSRIPVVAFITGSPGSGKTTSANNLLNDKIKQWDIIFDGTFADFKRLDYRVKEAEREGYSINIAYVFAKPIKAFTNILNRLATEKRPIPIGMFLRGNKGYFKTLKRIHEEYKGHIGYVIIDNNGEKGNEKFIGIDNLEKNFYNIKESNLIELINEYYEQGKINPEQLSGIFSGYSAEKIEIRTKNKRLREDVERARKQSGYNENQKDKTIDNGEHDTNEGDNLGRIGDEIIEGGIDDESRTNELEKQRGDNADSEVALEKISAEDVEGNGERGNIGEKFNRRSGQHLGSDAKKYKVLHRKAQPNTEHGRDNSLGDNRTRMDTAEAGKRNVAGNSSPSERGVSNFAITDDTLITDNTFKPVKRADKNIEAITLLKTLQKNNLKATPTEQEVLVQYVGWGGIPQIFDELNKEWEEKRNILKSLLSKEEYTSSRKSTLNAHYTSPQVIRGIWKSVKRLGFKGGRILEPSMGTGHFFGLIPTFRNTLLYGVELDNITGQIAKLLYPNARIEIGGYEKQTFPENYFDLAVSNVPFGDYGIVDDSMQEEYKKNIHGYFFAKALSQVRPGGIIAFVTSRYLLDSARKSRALRENLKEQGVFLGAIRLPNTAFKSNAGTEVVTDVIFIQKRTSSRDKTKGENFTKVVQRTIDGEKLEINEYFEDHPEMILGKLFAGRGRYGREKVVDVDYSGTDLEGDLMNIVNNLPEGTYKSVSDKQKIPQLPEYIEGFTDKYNSYSDGEIFVENNNIYQKQGQGIVKLEKQDADKDKIIRQIELNKIARRILSKQLETMENTYKYDMELLNEKYDEYVIKYGYLNIKSNRDVLITKNYGADPNRAFVVSLEEWDDSTKEGKKSARFSKRTAYPIKKDFKVETIDDAIALSYNFKNGIDLDYISELLNKTKDDVIAELSQSRQIYFDGDNWIGREDYLSGNVRAKLKSAKAKYEISNDPIYLPNIEDLTKALPLNVSIDQIIIPPGATWLPISYYKEFIQKVFKINNNNDVLATYLTHNAEYRFGDINKVSSSGEFAVSNLSGIKLFEDLCNNKVTKVYVKDENGNKVIEPVQTEMAKRIKKQLEIIWNEWVKTPDKQEEIESLYNENRNNYQIKTYNGQHLTLPYMSNTIRDRLFPHVKDAVWRIMQSGNTLLAHGVGFGKTWSMTIAAMEMRRIGKAKKPMHVVKNHMIGQYAKEFYELYPNAKLLVLYPADINKYNRQLFMSRIANGDYDSIIIPVTVFERLPISPETEAKFVKEEYDSLSEQLNKERETADKHGGRGYSVKQMENKLVKYANRLEILTQQANKIKKESVVSFEDLGVDYLFVDEAHNYKNLYFNTSHTNIKGLTNSHANKSMDMYMKIRKLVEMNGDCITFATGTPLSNTMAEMYTFMRYLQPRILNEMGLDRFDAWIKDFGNITSEYEAVFTGGNYKEVTRVKSFQNVPELIKLFRQVADVKTKEDITLDIPALKNGKNTEVIIPANEETRRYTESLIERYRDVTSGVVDPTEDNPLKIMTDGRKASIDLRLVGIKKDILDSKINRCVDNVGKVYNETKDTKGTQIIFLDYGVPRTNSELNNIKKEYKKLKDYITKLNLEKSSLNKELNKVVNSIDNLNQEELDKPDTILNEIGRLKYTEDLLNDLLKGESISDVIKYIDDSIDYWTEEYTNNHVDLFNDIKNKLVKDYNVKPEDILLSSDSRLSKGDTKQKLYDAVNRGDIRIVITTTEKMSEGTNIQKRLVALHHLNPPLKPAQLEQREGRILRAGNSNDVVEIFTYIQEGSIDSYIWKLLSHKSRMIRQVMTKDLGHRNIEDIGETTLTYEEYSAIASGDDTMLTRMRLQKDIDELMYYKNGYIKQQDDIKQSKINLPQLIESYEDKINKLKFVQKVSERDKAEEFSIELEGNTYKDTIISEEEKEEVAQARKEYRKLAKNVDDGIKFTKEEAKRFKDLVKKIKENEDKRNESSGRAKAGKLLEDIAKDTSTASVKDKRIGSYKGATLYISSLNGGVKIDVIFNKGTVNEIRLAEIEYVQFEIENISGLGIVRKISNTLDGIYNEIKRYENYRNDYQKKYDAIKDYVEKPFPDEDKLQEKVNKLNEIERRIRGETNIDEGVRFHKQSKQQQLKSELIKPNLKANDVTKKIYEAFTNVDARNTLIRDLSDQVGDKFNLIIPFGNDSYGVTHILRDHYGEASTGTIYADEFYLVTKVIKEGNPKLQEHNKKIRYDLVINGTRYTVIVRMESSINRSLTSFFTSRKPVNKKVGDQDIMPHASDFQSSSDDNINLKNSDDIINDIQYLKGKNYNKLFNNPDLRDKFIEKLLNSFKGYKKRDIVFLSDEEIRKELKGLKGNTPFGYVWKDGKVHINKDKVNIETPIHEIGGHIFLSALKKSNPMLYNTGLNIISKATGLLQEISESYPELTGEAFLYKVADDIDKFIDNKIDTTTAKRTFGTDLASGLGSLIGFMIPNIGMSKLAVGGAKYLPTAITALTGILANGGSAFDESLKKYGDPEKAYIELLVNGGMGITESIPIAGFFNRFDKVSGNYFSKAIKSGTIKQIMEEGRQEYLQTLTQGVLSKMLHDEDNRTWTDVILKEPGYAGLIGGILGGGMNVTGIGGKKLYKELKTKSIKGQLSNIEKLKAENIALLMTKTQHEYPNLFREQQDDIKGALYNAGIEFKEVSEYNKEEKEDRHTIEFEFLENLKKENEIKKDDELTGNKVTVVEDEKTIEQQTEPQETKIEISGGEETADKTEEVAEELTIDKEPEQTEEGIEQPIDDMQQEYEQLKNELTILGKGRQNEINTTNNQDDITTYNKLIIEKRDKLRELDNKIKQKKEDSKEIGEITPLKYLKKKENNPGIYDELHKKTKTLAEEKSITDEEDIKTIFENTLSDIYEDNKYNRHDNLSNIIKENINKLVKLKQKPDSNSVPLATQHRQQGFMEINGKKYIRQKSEDVPKIKGNETTVQFTQKKKEKGYYALVPVSKIQPSHKKGYKNPMHFISEGQPRNRESTASLRDAGWKKATNLDPNQLGISNNAYFGSPVINERGELIQGSGRADALQIYYDINKNDSKKYKEFINNLRGETGLTIPENTQENMVLVRVIPAGDDTAIELGNYVSSELEDVTGKLKAIDKSSVNRLTSDQIIEINNLVAKEINNEDKTLKDIIRENANTIVRKLQEIGSIREDESELYFNEDGSITANGIQNVYTFFKETLFKGGNPGLSELFNRLPLIIKAGIEKSILNIIATHPDKSLQTELQNAIIGYVEYMSAKAGNKELRAAAWLKQISITGEVAEDKYSEAEQEIIKLLDEAKKQSEIANMFRDYYKLTKDTPPDLFNPDTILGKSKEQALTQIFKNYGQNIKTSNIKTETAEESSKEKQGIQGETGAKSGADQASNSEEKTEVKSSEKLQIKTYKDSFRENNAPKEEYIDDYGRERKKYSRDAYTSDYMYKSPVTKQLVRECLKTLRDVFVLRY